MRKVSSFLILSANIETGSVVLLINLYDFMIELICVDVSFTLRTPDDLRSYRKYQCDGRMVESCVWFLSPPSGDD